MGGSMDFILFQGGFTGIPFTGAAREMGVVCTLRDVSLKEARETATGGRSILREGRDPIKEREKQKREAISNFHYLKEESLFGAAKAFEAKLKSMTFFHRMSKRGIKKRDAILSI